VDFELSADQRAIQIAVRELCAGFDDGYWSRCDTEKEFPWDFYRAFAEGRWLGIAIPERWGGSGLGISEAALLLEEVAASGAGYNGASCLHLTIFGLNPVVRHGSDVLRDEVLPRAVRGDLHVAFGITEPNAGLDTSRITTFARRQEGGYLVSGRKVWTSKAQESEKVLLLTRTAAREQGARPTDGMTLFLTDLRRPEIVIRPIAKMGRNAVSSNEVFIDGLFVPDEHRVGEEGEGFRHLLDGLNPERILIAAGALGLGRAALRRAVAYAGQRIVFDRPIGQNQGVQFPLAEALARLDAAELMIRKAAWLYDRGAPCGREANTAKLLAADACWLACDTAVQTHGGFGYAVEYHVERYLREARLIRIAPITQELVLAYLGEHVLGLPRSY
jgi:acyl-CoA dehydrogenase